MGLKNWLRRKIRSAAGTREIIDALNSTGAISVTADGQEVLPGTEWSRYLIPVDCPPSSHYGPRWGYSAPRHQGLVALFTVWQDSYPEVVEDTRRLKPFLSEINGRYDGGGEPGWTGGPINALDLAILYRFVCKYRPRTYLEVGSGVTTCFARRAVSDQKLETRIISIDPQPRSNVDAICDEAIRDGLEAVDDLDIFERLEAGDIVFVDGSHRSFMNSDVTVFMLDIVPMLKPGVIVHFHDILLPCDYPASFKNWYWNEQYILAVYLLAAREQIRILMPSYLVSSTAGLKDCLRPPILAIGDPEAWLSGGSLWFTHVEPGAERNGERESSRAAAGVASCS
ncbi:MAG: class I SAM-dependent methyltransferase [Planctomycetota bacterium]|jgi:hypothetical protein